MLPLYGIEACNFFCKVSKNKVNIYDIPIVEITPPFPPYSSGNSPARIHFTYDT